ncbi:MAG: enoyl-CoA hydratase/isomerase family protein [Betaproteobacteria bacterium]|nr:enoyl-CoA hydratase/isomerase family protein [Betaproteobacteria bacterium]
MNYQTILTSQDGAARILTLNRPDKRNAVSTLTMQEIIDELEAAGADDTVRAVIITGGPSFFPRAPI